MPTITKKKLSKNLSYERLTWFKRNYLTKKLGLFSLCFFDFAKQNHMVAK